MAQNFHGNVTFTLDGKPSPHRFQMCVTDEDKVVIWIEDRQSKKQWCTKDLETKDFITNNNSIPTATVADYAERFAACLGSTDEVAKYKTTLSIKGSERVLVLALPFQWAMRDFSVEYKFVMHEVPLERVDILSARVRDIEGKVATMEEERVVTKNLSQRVAELEDDVYTLPVYAQATTQGEHTTNETLVWSRIGSYTTGNAVEFLATGPVRFRVSGVFAIDIGVAHINAQGGDVFELRKSDLLLASGQGNSDDAFLTTTPLRYVLAADANDEITVVFKGDGTACTGSYMTIVKL